LNLSSSWKIKDMVQETQQPYVPANILKIQHHQIGLQNIDEKSK